MKSTSEMPVIILEGSPRQRGQTHGEALRTQVREHISRMKAFVGEALKKDADTAVGEFISDTNFMPAIRKWTPELVDEMEGTAEGAGVDFRDVYALNLGDETWWYFMEKNGDFNSPTVGGESCSSLGVDAQNGLAPMVAQNLDLPAYYDGLQALLHIKEPEKDLETFAFTFAGVVGAVGVNSKGVGMCENTLIELRHAYDGLPVMHVSRGILSQPTLEEAVSFIHTVKHASGQNYVVGSPEGVVDYECSAGKVRRFLPFEDAKLVYHTNHAFVNDDRYPIEMKPGNSTARFGSLEESLRDQYGRVTVDMIKKTLSSHDTAPFEVCVHPSETKHGITANSIIYELSENPVAHYTAGPPCETDFLTRQF